MANKETEWTEYHNPGRGSGGRAQMQSAGIQKSGHVTITPQLATELGNPEHVVVLYHAKNHTLGIRTGEKDGGFTFKTASGSKSYYVRCKAALKHFGLIGYHGRFQARYSEDDAMIIIDLTESLK